MRNIIRLTIAIALFATASANAEWWDDAKKEVLDAAKGEIGSVKDDVLNNTEGKYIKMTETPATLSVTNWTDQYIEVTAIATADYRIAQSYAQALSLAEAGARAICQRKLMEEIGGVHVSSLILLKNEMVRDATTKTMTDGMLTGAKEISVTHEELADGSVLCTMTMGLLLTTDAGLMKVGNYVNTNNPQTYEAYAPVSPVAPDKNYTGVIIDATELDVVPALMPNVLTEDGKIVYGSHMLEGDLLLNEGTSTYARTIKEAMESRAGNDPFIVKALKTIGATACDLVLPGDIADELFGLDEKTGVLSEGRVVIMTR
jgi:hypothetical protein